MFASFWVNDELFFGVDHLHFVERALGNESAAPQRFHPNPSEARKAKLTIYHDFSSPWSYIGSTQVSLLTSQVALQARAYPDFCSMEQLAVFLTPPLMGC